MRARILLLTAATLVAFAANSWLCRAALRSGAIDPISFTAVRLACGAAVLWLLARRGTGAAERRAGSWASAGALFAYAICFSLAYLALDAGIGALVLFAAVQLTMLAGGVAAGHRPGAIELLGVVLALGGLVVLGAPGATAPPAWAGAGMTAAGVAWGIYSLRGRGARRPLLANADNFVRALPAAATAFSVAVAAGRVEATPRGLALAAISGGVTSGLGYALWYAVLPSLKPLVAGTVQLLVPVIAALGGVAMLGESPSGRLIGAGALIVGGLALALSGRRG